DEATCGYAVMSSCGLFPSQPQLLFGSITGMNVPFPGMDPYLEHPVLWESVHARLIIALANQLQPRLDPRYVTSVEERVFIEGPQRRIPDVWIQKTGDHGGAIALAEADVDTAVVLEVQ